MSVSNNTLSRACRKSNLLCRDVPNLWAGCRLIRSSLTYSHLTYPQPNSAHTQNLDLRSEFRLRRGCGLSHPCCLLRGLLGLQRPEAVALAPLATSVLCCDKGGAVRLPRKPGRDLSVPTSTLVRQTPPKPRHDSHEDLLVPSTCTPVASPACCLPTHLLVLCRGARCNRA